jgi:hypothetical protein
VSSSGGEARREYLTALYLEPGHDKARFNLMFLETERKGGSSRIVTSAPLLKRVGW